MSSQNASIPPGRSGFVCLAGPTNSGKSTLMNAVVGHKIAIITPKPQTTRNRILGIHSVSGRGQIIFVDTPGLHQPKGRLGERMVDVAVKSLENTDLALLVVDVTRDQRATEKPSPLNALALDRVVQTGVPIVVALNKIDRVRDKSALLPIIEAYAGRLSEAEIVPISALTREGLDRLEAVLFERLPEGPPLYPTDLLSDQVERFIAAEVIREKVMLSTRDELPYSVAVEVESWEEGQGRAKRAKKKGAKGKKPEGGLLKIGALIHVERDSQKGILIGKGGQRLKEIGTAAREELELLFGTKVFLELYVRVEKNWTKDPKRLDRFL